MASTHPGQTTTNWTALFEAYLLTGIGAMVLGKTLRGQLPLYIHPRYTPLVLVTAVVVLLLGASKIWQVTEASQAMRSRIGLYALLIPVLLGTVIPAKPTGSELIDPRQLNNIARGYRGARTPVADDTTQWTLYDWTVARYSFSPEQINGEPIDVVGFVYRAPDQPAGEFEVARYTLACCVADRGAVSLPVTSETTDPPLSNDQWVRVTGTVEARAGDDGIVDLVVTNAQVEPVEQPDEPYLYP